MKILFISHLFPNLYEPIKGAFIQNLALSLVSLGHDVIIIAPIPKVPPFLWRFLPRWGNYKKVPFIENFARINVYHPRYIEYPQNIRRHRAGYRMYRRIRSLVEEITQQYKIDLIHCHTIIPDGHCGSLLKKELGIPLVTTVHGYDFQIVINWGKEYRRLIGDCIRETDRIITVSSKLARIGKEVFGSILSERLSIVGMGAKFYDNAKIISPLIGQKRDHIILTSVSSLMNFKGIDINIKAVQSLIKEFPNLIYVVIGDGPERKKLETLVSQLNLEKYVRFIGFQPPEFTAAYLKTSDVFCLPSWNEGFGIAYLEAMGYGIPVIGVKGQGAEDFIVDGKNGFLVSPKDVNAVVDILKLLIMDSIMRKRIGERGRETARTEYNWQTIAEKHLEIYLGLNE